MSASVGIASLVRIGCYRISAIYSQRSSTAAHNCRNSLAMQCSQLVLVAVLASATALAPTIDRRAALALPLAVVPAAARAADEVIVSGTVSAADAVVEPDAALYVTMRRGGAPQAAFSKFKAVPEPSLAAVRIPMKGKTFPVDFSIPRSALFPDAPALPDEIKDVARTQSAPRP